jgi:hypothetical protein
MFAAKAGAKKVFAVNHFIKSHLPKNTFSG